MDKIYMRACPHCGNPNPHLQLYPGKDGFRTRYAILCDYQEGGCGAEGGRYHSVAEAIEFWNARATTDEAWLDLEKVIPYVGQQVLICTKTDEYLVGSYRGDYVDCDYDEYYLKDIHRWKPIGLVPE